MILRSLIYWVLLLGCADARSIHGGGAQGSVSVLPAVSLVRPTGGGTAGGTPVTITGSNFSGATAVNFGGASATFVVASSTTITVASTPAGSGNLDITVTTPSGTSAVSSADKFLYQDDSASLNLNSTTYTDNCGNTIWGTETRSLVTHRIPSGLTMPATGLCGGSPAVTCNASQAGWDGTGCWVIFLANGFWMDTSCGTLTNGRRPQIYALNSPTGTWNQDSTVPSIACSGTNRADFDVSNALSDATYSFDSAGPITPVEITFASGATSQVNARDDVNNTWVTAFPAGQQGQDRAALGHHVDLSQSPNQQYLLIGNDSAGIYHSVITHGGSLAFTASTTSEPWGNGTCRSVSTCTNQNSDWGASPTLNNCSPNPNTVVPCVSYLSRITALIDCTKSNGVATAFAAVGFEIWERVDQGPSSYWKLNSVMPNASVGNKSNTGLRGATCIPNRTTTGQAILASTEGGTAANPTANLWYIDPNPDGGAGDSSGWTADVNMNNQFNTSFPGGVGCNYRIDAYNSSGFTKIGTSYVFGEGTTFCPTVPTGHSAFAGFFGQLDWLGMLWIRSNPASPTVTSWPNSQTTYANVKAVQAQQTMATRAQVCSPFASDKDPTTNTSQYLYYGGMDANNTGMTSTEWVNRVPLSTLGLGVGC